MFFIKRNWLDGNAKPQLQGSKVKTKLVSTTDLRFVFALSRGCIYVIDVFIISEAVLK